MKKYIAAFLVIALCFSLGALVAKVYKPVANAAPQDETTILGGNYFNNSVSEVVVDADGIAYVGGSFTSVGKESALAASISTTTGELVTGELGLDTGGGEEVTAVASDGSGGWYIGGYFSSVAGVAINNLAHIESDGSVDETWNPNPNDQIYSISVSGSDIYVAGTFGTIGGQFRGSVAKLNNTNGNADATWDPDPDDYVTGVVVSGSDVYAFGDFASIGGQSRNYLAKLNNTNGNADATWNPAPDSSVADVKVSGSDVYVGGYFTAIGGQSRIGAAKLNNTNGNADATWNPNSDGIVNSIAISGSDIYVSGNFSDIGGQTRARLAKLNNTNGNADVTWDPAASGFDDGMYAIAVSGTSVYAVGDFTSIGGQSRFGIAKLNNSNGNADSSWNASPDAYVTDIAVYNSDIYVSGGFSTIGGTSRQHLAAINLSTNELTSWNPAPNGSEVTDIAVFGSDIYAAGDFTTIGGQSRAGLAKLNNTNGNADASWDPSPNGTVRDIAISDSDIYVGGSFTTIGGQSRNRIAKISLTDNPTGLADASWNPNSSSAVYVITVSGSYIYVGGVFATIGGDSRNGLARLLSDGTADPDWEAATMTGLDEYGNPIVQVEIRDIKISGDDVYIAGAFSVIGGVSRNQLAKLSADDAGLDSTWNPNPDGDVYSVAIIGDGVIVGGSFGTIGGQSRTYLAKLNDTNGNADTAWNPSLSDYVNSVAIYESSVLVGGQFTTYFKRYDFPIGSFSAIPDSGGGSSSGSSRNPSTPSVPLVPGVTHPLGTNIKDSAGIVYTVTTSDFGVMVRRPYTSWGAFISYGFNTASTIVDANSSDLILPVGNFVPPQDGSIICSDRTPDRGTCYLMTQGQKAGFTSDAVFTGQGFSFSNTSNGDVSFLTATTPISSATARHLPGALVNNKGTYQIVGNAGLLGFPSASVFSSWGYDFAKAVKVNTADTALAQTGVVTGRIAGQIRLFY
jgi:hypothetical protein